jgi:hypothetical protein
MKMINITSIMSTIGVTLISEFSSLALCLFSLPFVVMALFSQWYFGDIETQLLKSAGFKPGASASGFETAK